MNVIFRFVCLEHAIFLCDPGSDYDWWACGCPRSNGREHVTRIFWDTNSNRQVFPPDDRVDGGADEGLAEGERES